MSDPRHSQPSEAPARVLMFVPQYPFPVVGGLEKQSHELARTLVRAGVAVQVLSGKVLPDQPRHQVVDGVPVARLPWRSTALMRALILPQAIVAAMWRARGDFDVVHVHQHSWISVLVIQLARLLGKPTLAKLANVGEFGLPGMGRNPFGRVRRWLFLRSDAVVAMSEESIRELRHLNYPEGRVLVTPNGIGMREDPAPVRQEGAGRPCRVVFVGRLTAQKQLHVLLEAWAVISRTLPGAATLELWGDGELEPALRKQCRDLGIDGEVAFAGHVDDVATKLFDADVFVLPSLYEGNSNAVLEAMAAGLPIVSTPVGGTAMQLGDKGRPWLFTPGDVAGLSDRLSRLIGDPVLRRSLGQQMQVRARRHFEIGVVARSYAVAYRELAAGRREGVHRGSNPVVVADV